MTQQNPTGAAGTDGQKPQVAEKAPKPATKMIRTLRPIRARVYERTSNSFEERIVEVGQVVEVHPEDAKMFVETQYKGHYGFQGERYGEDSKKNHDYRRAEYVKP